MQKLRNFVFFVMLFTIMLPFCANEAFAQATTYSSLADYNTALASSNVTTNLEDFSSVSTNSLVSQTTGDNWNGFSVVADGFGSFGNSGYCPQLNDPFSSFPTACLDYNIFAPSTPGIVGAFAVPGLGGGELTFTPTGEMIGFALDYVDWNDISERSAVRVTLSNGASIDVSGPPASADALPGFFGLIIDSSLHQSGIHIDSILWYGLEDELVGIYNVRTTEIIRTPEIAVDKDSALWDTTGTGKFSLPDNEVYYTIAVRNDGNGAVDSDSLFIVDSLPASVDFWNGDIDAGGTETFAQIAPVGFEQVVGTGMTFDPATDLRYASGPAVPSNFDDCTSIPMDGSFRPDVRFICINPQGVLDYGTTSPRIDFVFRVRIK